MALAGELLLPDLQADRQKENWVQVREAIREAAHAVCPPDGISRSAQKGKSQAAHHARGPGPGETTQENRTKTTSDLCLEPGRKRAGRHKRRKKRASKGRRERKLKSSSPTHFKDRYGSGKANRLPVTMIMSQRFL